MSFRVFLCVLCCTVASTAVAQQQDILPTLSGDPLVEALAAEFRPDVVFGYDRARDSLFAAVYYEPGEPGEPGTVRCVYTDWPISIDLTSPVAPRTQANDQGLNTEHTWPQSFGAGSGHPRSNLHHLFPTRADANSSRSNYPFADLPEAVVSRWWYLDENQSETPPPPLELWSRTATALPAFQPRDEHKGRVARAMFYFYTIYLEAAVSVDPLYFDIQKDVLYDWHRAFPADSMEHVRNNLIATYQDNRVNPFITDSTLIRRAYFTDPSDGAPFDAIYTFDGTTGCDNENADVAAQPEGVTFSRFTRTGVVCNQGTNVFNSRDWATSGDLDGERYVEFIVTADEGRLIEFEHPNRLSFVSRRSPTGPTQAEVRFSMDGGEFVTLGAWAPGEGEATESFFLPELQGALALRFRLYGWNAGGSAGTMRFENVRLTGRTTSPPVATEPVARGGANLLESIFPNPARGAVTIGLRLGEEGTVFLAAYDVLGRRVATIADGPMPAGTHELRWTPERLAAGVYLVRLETPAGSATSRVTLSP